MLTSEDEYSPQSQFFDINELVRMTLMNMDYDKLINMKYDPSFSKIIRDINFWKDRLQLDIDRYGVRRMFVRASKNGWLIFVALIFKMKNILRILEYRFKGEIE